MRLSIRNNCPSPCKIANKIVEYVLRGHPDEMPTPRKSPLPSVNLKLNVLISTGERPPS